MAFGLAWLVMAERKPNYGFPTTEPKIVPEIRKSVKARESGFDCQLYRRMECEWKTL